MSTAATFRHLSMLLLVIEKLSITQRMRQLRFYSESGALVGQLILDGAMVSCGVWVAGATYIDEEFRREAAPISAPLRKLLLSEAISFEEMARVQAIPLVARRALCQVTARALRQLAVLADLAQIRIVELPGATADGRGRPTGLPASLAPGGSAAVGAPGTGQALRFVFSPVDLLLAAGRSGRFHEADTAAKIYEMHPEPIEERWLFQWQASQIGEAWPVMTTRQSDKQTNGVAQFGLLGQSLVRRFAIAQRLGTLRGTAAELAMTHEHLYFVVLTDRYMTLLVYAKGQVERVLRFFQDLVFDTPSQAPLASPQLSLGSLTPSLRGSVALPEPPPEPPPALTSEKVLPPPAATSPEAVTTPAAPPASSSATSPLAASSAPSPPPPLVIVSTAAGSPEAKPEARSETRSESRARAMPEPTAGPRPAVIATDAVVTYPEFASARAQPAAIRGASETASAGPSGPVSVGAPGRELPPRASAVTLGDLLEEMEPVARSGELSAVEVAPTKPPADLASVDRPPPPIANPEPAAPAQERADVAVVSNDASSVERSPERPAEPSTDHAVERPAARLAERPSEPLVEILAAPPAEGTGQDRSASGLPLPTPAAELPSLASVPSAPASPSEISVPEAPVLRVRSASAEFDGQVILSDLNFELASRGLYALVGAQGAGKSSLLGVLSGRHRAGSGWKLSGSIWYCNLPLGVTLRPAVLGAVVTRPSLSLRGYLLADLDAVAAKRYAGSLAAQLLDRVRLAPLIPALSETLGGPRLHLSTGEWRRLAIARELASSPPLLCLDDALLGLSPDDREVLLEVLQSEARERAVLYTTTVAPPDELPLAGVFHLRAGQLQPFPAASSVSEPALPAEPKSTRLVAEAPSPPRTAVAVSIPFSGSPPAPAAGSPAPPVEVVNDTSSPRTPETSVPPDSAAQRWPSPPGLAPPAGAACVIWSSTAPILRLRNFGIVSGGRPVLSGINLDLPDRGLHLLVGRDGVQRRMLLRALCGLRGGPLQITGDALFGGGALDGEHGLVTLVPNPRLAMLTVREHLMHGPPPWQAGGRLDRTQRAQLLFEQSGFPELQTTLEMPLCDLGTYERRVVELLVAVSQSPLGLALHDVLPGVERALQPRLLRLLADQAARRAILLFTEDAQPYLGFAFTPPVRRAWLGEEHITAEPAD